MPKRVCVFVDGENFRHAICELFSSFDRKDYLPKRAKWDELFDWLVSRISPGGERVRTYWYVIEWMDFFPYGLSRLQGQPEKLIAILSRHRPYAEELAALDGEARTAKLTEIVESLDTSRRRIQDRFSGWIAIQNGIARKHKAIEFRRAGAIRCNLFDGAFGPEKAVDVKLASDLIVLKDIYDVAVVVSGDQDYVPAVQIIKNEGKRVVNVAFKTRGGRLLPGGARRLNQETDESLQVEHGDLARYLGI